MKKRDEFIQFSPPSVTEREVNEVVSTIRSGWLTRGPKTTQFESEMARYVGVSDALALSSCTAGLFLALKSLGLGPGDEVITTPMTFAATVNVIEHVGARPVLVDIDPHTLNMDFNLVAAAINKSTKAMMVVHYGGHPVELDRTEELSEKHGFTVIEDAAHALGATYRGHRIGSNPGHLTAFSFYANKNLTTGEGGLLVGPPALLDRARVLSLHGMNRDAWKRFTQKGHWYYEINQPGYKYNMTDIQASLGIVQLSRFEEMQARRQKVVDHYRTELKLVPEISLLTEREEVSLA